MLIKTIFWILIGTVIYCYAGYTIILAVISWIKYRKKRSIEADIADSDLPPITFVIAAYNERTLAPEKIMNSFAVDYPESKVFQLWATDGSDDGTPDILNGIDQLEVQHQPIRKGKTAALNRVMPLVKTPVTIFSDANTTVSQTSAKLIAKEFLDPMVGCVVGEKRILSDQSDDAVSSGEGAYWRYESLIKRLESESGSALSAAGELYAIRTELYQKIDEDIILDDFVESIGIRQKGYKLKYNPDAFAIEKASINITEEKKRKRRIAAGAFQTLFRYPGFMNPFRNCYLAFQYISHKVLRWIVVPFAVFLIPFLNLFIVLKVDNNTIYQVIFILLMFFFAIALLGWLIKNKKLKEKIIFIPYYILMMNISILEGFWLYLTRRQNVVWEKSTRQT